MSFGFFGIQFGWGLQMANMSAIYEYLGATESQIPILWLAAPLTGLIVQPIVGHLSDRTWCRLGRRRPYFLGGTVLATIALFMMPHSKAVWMAAILLWMLDFSVNISMEPFRAFVGDLLPSKQRAQGFAVQSLLIGMGAVLASSLPWLMTNVFGVSSEPVPKEAVDSLREHVTTIVGSGGAEAIPATVRYSFYVGAAVFLTAVLWTIFSTKEYPPEDMEAFKKMKAEKKGIKANLKELAVTFVNMPRTMRQLAWVQVFTWLGLFCMWIYFSIAVARSVFGAVDHHSAAFTEGVQWGGVCFSVYNAVCFVFAFLLIALARRVSPKLIHMVCLLCGGIGLISVMFIHNKYMLMFSMAGVGIAWASIVSMPYAMLSGAIPPGKMGVYMGIFNFFIVIPQIIASVGLGWVMTRFLNSNSMAAVVLGGVCMVIASFLVMRVQLSKAEAKA
ncbi:MFS transporter [Candidatus Auribacterota bacterium]